jgi:CheY-like chemotaxis protein
VKVLIVDDDADALKMIARLMTHRGHQVQSCTTPFGVSAMVLRDPPDLILLDVMMPGLSGPALAEVLGRLPLQKAPVIALWSAMDDQQLRDTGRQSELPTVSKARHPTQIIDDLERIARRVER